MMSSFVVSLCPSEECSDPQAARQAALQKSLSTALLNHQISELESKVQSIQVSKLAPVAETQGQPAQAIAVNGQDANGNGASRGVKEKSAGLGRIDMDEEGRADALTHDEDIEVEAVAQDDEDDKWRVAVLDASVLIWAPRSVRRLSAKGWELVVPIDAIRTLDLLKKGSSHAAIGARSATRYIEHATRQYKLLSNDPSITVQAGTNYKRGTGIRIQREDESLPITELSELPIPIDDVPRWAGNVLSCAGWFARINQAEISGEDIYGLWPTLFVANPPLAVEALGGEDGRDHHAERGEGYLISQEAERFELALEVLRDEEQEDMSFEAETAGRKGRGRGGKMGGGGGGGRRGGGEGGGGGRGRGGRARHERNESKSKLEEPEREVKILLRRPAPPAEVAGGDDTSNGGRASTQGQSSPGSNPLDVAGASEIKGSPLALPPTLATASAALNGQVENGENGDPRYDQGGHGRQDQRGGGGRGRGEGRRGRGRGRGGRDGGPPSPGRGGFVLLQRPGPPRPPPVDGHIVRPPPPPHPSVPPPHHHHPPPPHHHRGGPPGPFGGHHHGPPHPHHHHHLPPPPHHLGPPPGPPHQFRGPPPPEFQPRVLQRPPPPPPPGPPPFIPGAGHHLPSRPLLPPPPPFPNPYGMPFRPSRSPYMDSNGFGGPESGFDAPLSGPRKVTLLQRPKG